MRARLAVTRDKVMGVIRRERSEHHKRFLAMVFGVEVVSIVSIHQVIIHLGIAGTIAAAEFLAE